MRTAAPAGTPCDLSIIVVNYNTAHLLDEMFAAVEAASGTLSVQTIVVDNASRDGSAALLSERYPDVELIANTENVGFGRANNQALARARGRYLLLLNTDAFVAAGGIERTVRYLDANPEVHVLGVRLVGRDGTLQPSCRYFPTPWNEFLVRTGLERVFRGTRLVDDMRWDHASVRECDWVPGCYFCCARPSSTASACSTRATSSTTRRSTTAGRTRRSAARSCTTLTPPSSISAARAQSPIRR